MKHIPIQQLLLAPMVHLFEYSLMMLALSGCASQASEEQAHTAEPAGSASDDDPHRKPDVILGTGLYDNHFIMPFTLVRDESITIDIRLERGAPVGNVISCKVTSGDAALSSDMGRACHLSAAGTGLRYYVLHIVNVDANHYHDVYITANRGRSRPHQAASTTSRDLE